MNSVTPFEQAATPRRAGQGTMVEQSRAVAEVQAAVVIAQQRPRDKARAMMEMREVCKIPALADRAFFRYSRGGETITGGSVHLARELARCWGNIDYGAKELARDDDRAQSEMLAFAWDLETNTRDETTFIVPHKRDTKKGVKLLNDMRDIYENNANNAARRLRECIFAMLPVWFTEEAKEICSQTLRDGGGVPLVKRIADCLQAFEEIGVGKQQIARKIGRPADQMLAEDVAQLGVIFKSIRRGEINKEEEFPREDGEQRQVPAGADGFEQAAAGSKPTAEAAPAATPDPEPVSAEPPSNNQGEAPPAKQQARQQQAPKAADDIDDEWAQVSADEWPDHVYRMCGDLETIKSVAALDVALASPKFAAYVAMAKHAPQSRKVMDAEIAKRRKELA